MKYKLLYTKQSLQDLQALDKTSAKRIVRKLGQIVNQNSPLKNAKKLKGIYKDLFRFRVGSYRAIFSKDEKGKITILTVIRVGHRKDIYRK